MKIAYFDFDGTIVKTNSLHYILALRSYKVSKDPSTKSFLLWLLTWCLLPVIILLHFISERSRDILTYQLYYGLTLSDITEGCERFWRKKGRNVFHDSVLLMVRDAYLQDYKVVIVSGSYQAIIESALRFVGIEKMVEAYIATTFHVGSDEIVRGRLVGEPNIQGTKVTRVRAYEASLNANPSVRLAVSDSSSDLPLLLYCDRACVIKPKRRLRREAKAQHWVILPDQRFFNAQAGASEERGKPRPFLLQET